MNEKNRFEYHFSFTSIFYDFAKTNNLLIIKIIDIARLVTRYKHKNKIKVAFYTHKDLNIFNKSEEKTQIKFIKIFGNYLVHELMCRRLIKLPFNIMSTTISLIIFTFVKTIFCPKVN